MQSPLGEPSGTGSIVLLLHWPMDAIQNKPLLTSQMLEPHPHSTAAFSFVPIVFEQADASYSQPFERTPSESYFSASHESAVHVDKSEQDVQVPPMTEIDEQATLHPLVGDSSLSMCPMSQEEMAVHVDASEQAMHVLLATEMALQSNDDSHPLARIPSLSYVSPKHEQHSSPWSVHQVQTVVDGFADCVEEQVIESPSVFFLPQTPQDVSKLQVPSNIFSSGYVGQPVHDLKIQFASSFDLKLNDFAL